MRARLHRPRFLAGGLLVLVLSEAPHAVRAQDVPAPCTRAACALRIQGGGLASYLLWPAFQPKVVQGPGEGRWVGPLVPSQELWLRFAGGPGAEQYQRFAARHQRGRWMRTAGLTGVFADQLVALLRNDPGPSPVGLAALAVYVGSWIPLHRARSEFDRAVAAYNRSLPPDSTASGHGDGRTRPR